MTRLIDINMISAMVEKIGLDIFLQQMTENISRNYRQWMKFEKSARLASHSKVGVIELMPISDDQLYGFKYVNGHPANTAKGLSTVMAFGALAEVETGYPLLLSELTLTTAFRTAATSIMAARVLARKNSRVMAIIGNGAQSEFQATAFHLLLGINEIHIFDIDKTAMDKFQQNLSSYKTLKVIQFSNTAEAVKGVDIITTITADKTLATILTTDMIEPGMYINGLGGDCPGKTEIHANVLKQAKIFVEYEVQTRIEGDIQQLDKKHPVIELWQVLSGQQPGRDNDSQVIIFDSVGFALEDFSALQYLYELSNKLGIGKNIELIPQMDNPKDLYGLLTKTELTTDSSKAA
ncbi:MAG: ornithine cyclodeaminase [Gammaproteobacteria bacterium]|jgi:ornithine cyclodeaminase|nr:ornithine cyclodeaminase [Gammaproteobacteria bacterium]MBT3725804.1 ornithine cyclodeaminase [Gammaproteobacteria bacterium]MBT4078552.1 ornithine cyclodeaminase [Gammaproteobacteria bacterium]MBT4193462.1 ornithine cyclodeaminase [Gammaproteobacteria bacterium]MBT4451974.1 ornithine cyclodeaminase [Gammaproteobacteria bacterium]